MEDCAEPSLAARLEARRLGIAMAAMMPMIATTMRSSISEKPSWRLFVFIFLFVLLREKVFKGFSRQRLRPDDVMPRRARSCHVGQLQGLCHPQILGKARKLLGF
jgi:predicted tellurium resistance membrane protein TerC